MRVYTYDASTQPCTTVWRDYSCNGIAETFCVKHNDYGLYEYDQSYATYWLNDNTGSAFTVPEGA